jgi:DNA-binding protein H-NS
MGKGRKPMAVAERDLDQMGDEEVMNLVIAAVNRLAPEQLMRAQTAILEKRRIREQEIKGALLAEFRERAASVGLPLEALFPVGRRTRADAGQPLTPKYRGPHGETWSGRGRQPNWMTELEAVGHDRSEFLIKPEEAA